MIKHTEATPVAEELVQVVRLAAADLRGIAPDAAMERPAPGKWSRKEILGHLVDSASNNHQRFVRAQEGAEMRGPGYAQDHWVAVQDYQGRDWQELIALWEAYNLHLAHGIRAIPAPRLATPCIIADREPVTLLYVVQDYLDHLKHHLRQIFPA
ncbi:MAG TPA: DinB family protein [Longimicrobium sp.]|nr:DinB family protein [Longimicrobium sp.]